MEEPWDIWSRVWVITKKGKKMLIICRNAKLLFLIDRFRTSFRINLRTESAYTGYGPIFMHVHFCRFASAGEPCSLGRRRRFTGKAFKSRISWSQCCCSGKCHLAIRFCCPGWPVFCCCFSTLITTKTERTLCFSIFCSQPNYECKP